MVVIWYEVMNPVEYLEGSGQMMFRSFCMGKKDNDREINEWYNEVNWDDRLEFEKINDIRNRTFIFERNEPK